MKKSVLLITVFILSACASAQQVTVTSEVTVTLTPPATETPAPTPTEAAAPAETVTMGGVTLTLDENGIATDMVVNGNYTDAQKAEKLAVVDPAAWGLEVGDGEGLAQIVKGPDGTHIVVDGENVARWVGTEWDWAVMEGLEGGNPLYKIAKVTEMNGKSPVDMKTARAESAKIFEFADKVADNFPGKKNVQPIYLFGDDDESKSIIGYSITTYEDKVLGTHNSDVEAVADAIVCMMPESGKMVAVKFKKVTLDRRTFN